VPRQMDFCEQALRQGIKELIQESLRLPTAVNLAKGPSQMVMAIAESQSKLLRAVAFMMDNMVYARSGVHEIELQKETGAPAPSITP